MIIGIDGNEANIREKVGIGQYAYQTLKHIFLIWNKKSESEKKLLNFKIYLKDKPRDDLPKENSWWKYKVFGPKNFWTQIALPYQLFFDKEPPNIFFTPSHYAPRFSSCPRVISIMDLSFIYYPNLFLKKDLHQLRAWTDYSVKKAIKILTISEFSKNEIIKYYKVPENKVVVTYPGYNHKIYKKSSTLKIKNYNISDDYILFVGTLQPRKNIVKLIEAFNILIRKYDKKTTQLILVGKKGWLYDEIFRVVKELNLEKRVIFTDFIADEDLAVLYQRARCFVLPSLYEGFGIPVIEAMACGCPVVASNISSLPEIVGKAGILIDPENAEDIAEGIYKAGFNSLKRKEIIKSGFERIKLFSWEKCAEKTLEVLKMAIS